MSKGTRNEDESHRTNTTKGYDPELEVVLCSSLDVLIKHGPHLVYTLSHNNIILHVTYTMLEGSHKITEK